MFGKIPRKISKQKEAPGIIARVIQLVRFLIDFGFTHRETHPSFWDAGLPNHSLEKQILTIVSHIEKEKSDFKL